MENGDVERPVAERVEFALEGVEDGFFSGARWAGN